MAEFLQRIELHLHGRLLRSMPRRLTLICLKLLHLHPRLTRNGLHLILKYHINISCRSTFSTVFLQPRALLKPILIPTHNHTTPQRPHTLMITIVCTFLLLPHKYTRPPDCSKPTWHTILLWDIMHSSHMDNLFRSCTPARVPNLLTCDTIPVVHSLFTRKPAWGHQ
ncbi:PAB1 binding protein [Histoplasma capsulatum]|uniref:PAB1 binding protein n=1 Tax=Ajellomyces capsulatus TaxID=5037 RepID=A0A8A1MK22_AJECA|nr:PAB1 binding protein [Histoplasma capsulatum]